jgi:hypothetical protein
MSQTTILDVVWCTHELFAEMAIANLSTFSPCLFSVDGISNGFITSSSSCLLTVMFISQALQILEAHTDVPTQIFFSRERPR